MTADQVASPRQAKPSAATAIDEPWPPPGRAWYGLGVLTLGLMFATVDRSILSLLVEPIKRDLVLTDTQMSLLIGFAFVFFYAFLGLPIARLADVHSRRLIIGIGIAFWSLMTALCGVAQNYWQMFWARVGVGAGESSFAPATYSILTDSFPEEKLPKAMAVLSVGFVYGSAMALILGSAVIHLIEGMDDLAVPLVGTIRPWQLVFFAVGLPGFFVAALMATVHEPRRRGLLARPGAVPGRPKALPVRTIARFLKSDWRSYAPMFVALGIKTLVSFGVALWIPTLFIRTYGWTAPEIGLALGLVQLTAAPLGMFAGSWLAGRFARQGHADANVRVVLIATIPTVPFSILFPLMPTAWLALALMAANTFFASLGIGPGNAALQIITPNEMRGQVRALYQFVFNVVGYGVGPTVVALFTDYLFGGDGYIRYSIALTAGLLTPIALVVTWFGLKPYGYSVLRARAGAWNLG